MLCHVLPVWRELHAGGSRHHAVGVVPALAAVVVLLSGPGEAPVGLQLFFGLAPGPVLVVQVHGWAAGLHPLGSTAHRVGVRVLAQGHARGHRRRSRPLLAEAGRGGQAVGRAGLGRVAAGARRLAPGRLHDALHVLVQDALRVLLVGVPRRRHQRQAVVGALGVASAVVGVRRHVVERGGGRRQAVARQRRRR